MKILNIIGLIAIAFVIIALLTLNVSCETIKQVAIISNIGLLIESVYSVFFRNNNTPSGGATTT